MYNNYIMSTPNNRQPRINIEETIQQVNTIGNQMLGTFVQMATPIVNEVCNNISNIQTNMGNLNQEALQWSDDKWLGNLKGSTLKRIKPWMWKRNIKAVIESKS